MIYFLYVPVESGKPEMAALEARHLEDAVREAEALPYAGRVGYLFDGDIFMQEVRTANLMQQAPHPAAQIPYSLAPLRPVEPVPKPG